MTDRNEAAVLKELGDALVEIEDMSPRDQRGMARAADGDDSSRHTPVPSYRCDWLGCPPRGRSGLESRVRWGE